MCATPRSFATSLPTDYQIVELAVALVQRVADINEHPPVLLSDAHKSALCKCYRSRCELTEERYAGERASRSSTLAIAYIDMLHAWSWAMVRALRALRASVWPCPP